MTSIRHKRGFTLKELVVVLVVMFAAALVWVAFSGVPRVEYPRERCRHNTKELAKSCIAYAVAGNYNRGTQENALPSLGPTQQNWHQGDAGNAGALWLLYKLGYIGPEHLLCLGAEQNADIRSINETDKALHEGTLGYSYLSQVPFKDPATGDLVTATTTTEAPSYLVLIADRNPRTRLGSAAIEADQNGKNSRNHGGEGQNFARIDGSAEWTETPRVFSRIEDGGKKVFDDIYMPGRGDVPDNSTTGMRTSAEDFYLIP